MTKIFISWSKAKSRDLAFELKSLLEKMAPDINVFLSEDSIAAGEHVQEKIINQIVHCDKLLLCFTKENKKSPWLLYEAGFACGLNKTVIPILFDNDPNWHSWIDNPMNIAREISANSDEFYSDIINSLGITDTKYTKAVFLDFTRRIETVKEKYRQVDVQCEDFVDALIENDSFHIESPIYRDKTAYFLNGFETYDLWKTIVHSFLYTGKYLWIYGRKNMKLFGGNFRELFDYLEEKSTNSNMSGIDFRCLFLNPNSAEVKHAHSQQDIFLEELKVTIRRAENQIGDNQVIKNCFRMYENRREEVIIRLDNCIIYSKPHFDKNGYPQFMTDSKFEVFSASSDRGKECIQKFCAIWDASTNLC